MKSENLSSTSIEEIKFYSAKIQVVRILVSKVNTSKG